MIDDDYTGPVTMLTELREYAVRGVLGEADILDLLDMDCDCFSAIRVTDEHRKDWLKGADPSDRWAVTLEEGGTFSYGRELEDAVKNALQHKYAPPELRAR